MSAIVLRLGYVIERWAPGSLDSQHKFLYASTQLIMFQRWREFTCRYKMSALSHYKTKSKFSMLCPFQGSYIFYSGWFYALPSYISMWIHFHESKGDFFPQCPSKMLSILCDPTFLLLGASSVAMDSMCSVYADLL